MTLAKSIQKIHDKLLKAARASASACPSTGSLLSSPSSSSSLGGRYPEQGWTAIKRRPKTRYNSKEVRVGSLSRRDFSTASGGRREKEQTSTATPSHPQPHLPLFPSPKLPTAKPARRRPEKAKSSAWVKGQGGLRWNLKGEAQEGIDKLLTSLTNLDPERLEDCISSMGLKKRSPNPQVGDWVEYRKSGRMTGIILQVTDTTYLILTSTSIFELVEIRAVTAFLPLLTSPFTDPSKALQILQSASEMAKTPPASSESSSSQEHLSRLSHPLLQYMREVEAALEKKRRDLMEMGFDQIYDRIQSLYPTSPSFLSSSSTSSKKNRSRGKIQGASGGSKEVDVTYCLHAVGIRGPPTPIEKLAMLDLLISDGERYTYLNSSKNGDGSDLGGRGGEGASFRVRDREFVEGFKFLRGLLREREESGSTLSLFVEKARKILSPSFDVATSGATAPAIKSSTPAFDSTSLATIASVEWTPSEARILRFIYTAVTTETRDFQQSPWEADIALLLKMLYPSSPSTTSSTLALLSFDANQARRFLKDVGLLKEWENWVVHENEVVLLREWGQDDERLEKLDSEPTSNAPTTSHLATVDDCDSIRQDFGADRVYTIDDPNASELDDGISVSPGPLPHQRYVTVHIADPTSSVPDPFGALGQVVRKRFRTEYFPEGNWKMFPEWFLKRESSSLGDAGGDGKGNKTVFVKFLVGDDGRIVGDAEVGVGWAKDFWIITYGAVDRLLGYDEPREGTTYYLTPEAEKLATERKESGGRMERETDDNRLIGDERAKEDLKFLWELGKQLLKRRVDDGAWFFAIPKAEVRVEPGIDYRPIDFTTSHLDATGSAPIISLTTGDNDQGTPAQTLVSELMILANRLVARYFTERTLPTIYRAQSLFANPSSSSTVLSTIHELRHPLTGMMDFRAVLKLGTEAYLSPAKASITPSPHAIMGIQDRWGYMKFTSPLRRYDDLVAHWQLKESLSKGQAKFQKGVMENILKGIDKVEKERGRIDRFANLYWTAYFLDKVHCQHLVRTNEAPSPIIENLAAIGVRSPSYSFVDGCWTQPAILKEFGVRTILLLDSEGEGVGLGEEKRVQLERIGLGPRSTIVCRLRKSW